MKKLILISSSIVRHSPQVNRKQYNDNHQEGRFMRHILILLITSSFATSFISSSHAAPNYSTCKEFDIGDVVEQYRHWNHEEQKWNSWQQPSLYATKWRVLELPKLRKPQQGQPELMITVQLIEGEFKTTIPGSSERPGYVDHYLSSINYKEAHPNSYLQFCDEFRKVK